MLREKQHSTLTKFDVKMKSSAISFDFIIIKIRYIRILLIVFTNIVGVDAGSGARANRSS